MVGELGEKVASKGERIYMKQGGEGKVCRDLRGDDTLLTIGNHDGGGRGGDARLIDP